MQVGMHSISGNLQEIEIEFPLAESWHPEAIGKVFLSETASGISGESGMPGGSDLWTNRWKCDSVFCSHTGRGQVIAAPEVGLPVAFSMPLQYFLCCYNN